MKSLSEIKGKTIALVGTVSIVVLAGCSSDKVLTDRPFIPAPSDQIPVSGTIPVPPMDTNNIAPLPDVPPFTPPKIEDISYTVQKGDSLWKIAHMHGVSTQELAAHNNMDQKKLLKVGTTLRIPPGGAPLPPEKLAAKKISPTSTKKTSSVSIEALPADGVYTVKSGDSLWKIAKKFNTSVDKLAAANNMDPKSPLQVGQKIRVSGSGGPIEKVTSKKSAPLDEKLPPPTKADVPVETIDTNTDTTELDDVLSDEDMKSINDASNITPSPAPTTPFLDDMKGYPHDVEQGETWATIAKTYGIKLDDLKKANPAASAAGEPKPGTQVIIPAQF